MFLNSQNHRRNFKLKNVKTNENTKYKNMENSNITLKGEFIVIKSMSKGWVLFVCCFIFELGIELRVLCMLGKCSTTN